MLLLLLFLLRNFLYIFIHSIFLDINSLILYINNSELMQQDGRRGKMTNLVWQNNFVEKMFHQISPSFKQIF